MIGITINEPIKIRSSPVTMSSSDIELEKKIKEREDLEKELERVENEVALIDLKSIIHFINNTFNVQTSFIPKIGMSSGSMPNTNTNKIVTFNVPSPYSQKVDTDVKMVTNASTSNNTLSCSSQARIGSQRRPVQLEGYSQLFFNGILGYLNAIVQELRNKLTIFLGNNVITCEDHLRCFLDLLNDYEVEHEDVVMKLFVHSLIEDAREWLKRFPGGCISSWRELEHCFKEKYGDKPNASYILNEFNNIKKLQNEFFLEFNARF